MDGLPSLASTFCRKLAMVCCGVAVLAGAAAAGVPAGVVPAGVDVVAAEVDVPLVLAAAAVVFALAALEPVPVLVVPALALAVALEPAVGAAAAATALSALARLVGSVVVTGVPLQVCQLDGVLMTYGVDVVPAWPVVVGSVTTGATALVVDGAAAALAC